MPVVLPGQAPWATHGRIGERAARHTLGALLATEPGDTLTWPPGVLPTATTEGHSNDLQVTAADEPSMDLRIMAGQCVLTRPGQGPYTCTLDVPGTITLDDADPVNPRIDLVIARVYDERLGDPATGFVIEALTGTPDPEPTPRQLPTGALALAAVTLGPGDTKVVPDAITDLRRATTTRGGIHTPLPGDDAAEHGAHPGATRYRNGHLETWTGTTWHPPATTRVYDTTDAHPCRDQTGLTAITHLDITDPGYPYRLLVHASAELTTHHCRADLHITLDSTTAPPLTTGIGPTNGTGQVITPLRPTGELTGAHTIYAVANRVLPTGEPAVWSATGRHTTLTALQIPA